MSSRNKFSDEELSAAAIEVMRYELAIFDSYADFPDHTFRGEFRLKMGALLHDVKRGAVKAAEYSMGFAFYAKRCIAAVLLIFTLTCITMPETVLAGYQKLIEVIETVFEEYTEYRYRVNAVGAIEEEFKPMKLGYLPEGMEEVRRRENENTVDILYMDQNDNYINIYQERIQGKKNAVYAVDSGEEKYTTVIINGEELLLIDETRKIQYLIMYGEYRISGTTNLVKSELIHIITDIRI